MRALQFSNLCGTSYGDTRTLDSQAKVFQDPSALPFYSVTSHTEPDSSPRRFSVLTQLDEIWIIKIFTNEIIEHHLAMVIINMSIIR